MSRPRMKAKIGIKRGSSDTKWVTVGSAFVLESGQINVVLDTLPVLPSLWDGVIALFPPDTKEDSE